MKKTYKIKNLSCSHCAMEIEDILGKIDGVKKSKVNFMLSRLTLEFEDGFDMTKEEIDKYIKKIEANSGLE